MIANRQSSFRLDSDELYVGTEFYPLGDVLYADVVDENGYQVSDFLRDADKKLIIYGAAMFGLIGFLILLTILTGVRGGGLWWLVWLPFWLSMRFFMKQIKELEVTRTEEPVTLRVHTRKESFEVLQTGNQLHAQLLARRVNRAVKHNTLN